jgi:hypothetical protein
MSLLPTDATSGFLKLPTCYGKPTGIPKGSDTGDSPCVFDKLHGVLWVFNQLTQEWTGAEMPYPIAAARGRVTVSPSGFDPLSLAWDAFFDPRYDYYSDNGMTLAVAADPVYLGKNQMNDGASLNISQATLATRMIYRVGANGVPWLEGDLSRYYDPLVSIPCTAGFCSAHLIKFTANGYYNLFEDSGLVAPMIWIDGSGRIESNAGGAAVLSGFNDGAWHSVITYTGTAGSPGHKVWVDGTLLYTSGSGQVSGTNRTINPFNRGNGTGWSGGIGYFGFGSFDPTANVADISAWMLGNKPT